MGSIWEYFVSNNIVITSSLTLVIGLTVIIWFFFIITNKSIIKPKCKCGVSMNGKISDLLMSNIDTLEDIRRILLSDDKIPVTLHDKVFLEEENKPWTKEDSLQIENFFDKASKENNLRTIIAEITTFLIRHLKTKDNETVNFSGVMSTHALNILYGIAFGRSFELDDPRILCVKYELESIIALWPKFNKECHPHYQLDSYFATAKGEFITRMKQAIAVHEMDNDVKKDAFIDALIQSKGNQNNIDDELAENLLVFFLCGYESLSHFFSSTMLLLSENLEVQENVYKELNESISGVKLSENSAFIQATVQELLRMIKPVPFAVRYNDPKKTSNDEILKECLEFLNLDAVLNDENHWDCPEKCKPTRFLDKSGKIVKHDAFIPFSIGKRSCPGQSFVEIVSLALLISIVKNFKLSKSTEETEVTSHINIHITSR